MCRLSNRMAPREVEVERGEVEMEAGDEDGEIGGIGSGRCVGAARAVFERL